MVMTAWILGFLREGAGEVAEAAAKRRRIEESIKTEEGMEEPGPAKLVAAAVGAPEEAETAPPSADRP